MKRINKKVRRWCNRQTCQVRLPGCSETNCVGAHYRMPGLSGMGQKPHDIFVAAACPSCHNIVDGRCHTSTEHNKIRLAHAEGVLRTIQMMVDDGMITWK